MFTKALNFPRVFSTEMFFFYLCFWLRVKITVLVPVSLLFVFHTTSEMISLKLLYFLRSNLCIYIEFEILKHLLTSQNTSSYVVTHKF